MLMSQAPANVACHECMHTNKKLFLLLRSNEVCNIIVLRNTKSNELNNARSTETSLHQLNKLQSAPAAARPAATARNWRR